MVATKEVASLSSASQPDSVAKVLFVTPVKSSDPEQGHEIMYASDDSVASSSITLGGDSHTKPRPSVVAEQKPTEVQHESPRDVELFDSAVGRKEKYKKPLEELLEEDNSLLLHENVAIQPSCHGGLNLSPEQLGSVFGMLHGAAPPPPPPPPPPPASPIPSTMSETSSASTTVTSNTAPSKTEPSDFVSPEVESLRRECSALKQVIRADAGKKMKLKKSLETLANATRTQIEDIKTLREEVSILKRDRDLVNEREDQHLETIRALKAELDAATSQMHVVDDSEIQQLRLENDLFASQIIENELDLRTIQSEVGSLQQQNSEMQDELESLQSIKIEKLPEPSDHKTDLVSKLKALEERLAAVESKREISGQRNVDAASSTVAVEIDVPEEHQICGKPKAEEVEVSLADKDKSANGSLRDEGTRENEKDGVEVSLQELLDIIPKVDGPMPAERNLLDAEGSWFCDCFPLRSDKGLLNDQGVSS